MHKVAKAQSGALAGWPTCRWTIDSQPRTVRIFRWAGAWAGFVVHGDVGITVQAVGLNPENVRLEAAVGRTAYHVDLTEPLVFPVSITKSKLAAALPRLETPPEWPTHADHQQLLTAR